MKQQKQQRYALYEHHLPEYFFRFPSLIRPVHWGHQLLHNRNRVVLHYLKKWMQQKGVNLNVLDAGCGEGNYLIPLAHTFRKSAFNGLDYNAQLVDFVKCYAHKKNLPIRTAQADLNEVEINEKYDLVICVAVMQMLKNETEFLSKIKGALHSDGIFVLNVPIKHKPIAAFLQPKKMTYTEVHGGISKSYSPESLVDLLQKAGFEVIDQFPTNGFWGTLGNELLNWGIDSIQRGSRLKRVISIVLFAFPLLPIVLFCNALNAISTKKRISGIVVSARIKG